MASLQNRGNQQPQRVLGNKPAARPGLQNPSNKVLQAIPEKKIVTNLQNKQQNDAKFKEPTQSRLPTLSTLRQNITLEKRQKLLQDVVRTGGKENGFMTYKARPEDVPDIYADDVGNEALVVAYVEHIYTYLYHREHSLLSKDYMDGMSVNPRMRTILVDWIVSVTHKFKMCQDTLFLSLNIVDRFLSIPEIDVTKDELQLIGVTAMFVAGKFEEVYPPDLEDYVYISDQACTKNQILDCEMMMVNALNFDFTRPLPVHFLRRCCKAANANPDEYCSAKFHLELAQMHIDFVEVKPSLLAAGALYLALLFRRRLSDFWDSKLTYYSSYEEGAVKQMASRLLDVLKQARTARLQCIIKKYATPKNFESSNITDLELDEVAKHFGRS
ncbi:G2/mitotic-specific cyclin-B-like isoform X2 [Paramacrobiotus metropolitanus]|uniref:G2/mitotic-specific cyclin-B-like isoform X2 n=1 Tax=Paramacrobiotus metropolitanus TaxID=2943436 RepID=UPI002446173D|nr:G2/mitotic-specific cyclin-B-like isoform X2 [Paramacrobiotus metropolitanus]